MAWWRRGKKDVAEAPEAAETAEPGEATDARGGALARLRRGLRKTAAGFRQLIGLKRRIDAELLEELEVKLYEADFGPELVTELIEEIRNAWGAGTLAESDQIAPFLQESLVTQRDGRYVIPLRADAKGRVKAVVHDQSSSGATLFVEPLQVVELNNQWRELQLESEVHCGVLPPASAPAAPSASGSGSAKQPAKSAPVQGSPP